MIRADACFEALVHDARADGTFRRGDAYVEHEESIAAKMKRAPSKVLMRLERERRRVMAKLMRRRAKAALREQRRLARMAGEDTATPAPEAVPQKSAPPKPSVWDRVKGWFGRKAVA
jgi:hypothetical protein